MVDCFAARLFTRCWRFRFSCSDTSPNWVVRTVFIPAWSIFPSIYAFPPPFLFPCILEIIDLYPGRGTLIALYLVHFCFVGGVLKEKMGRSFAQVYFLVTGERQEAIFRLKLMTCEGSILYVWLSLLGFFLGLILLFFQK